MSRDTKQQSTAAVNLENLEFYFDAIERDRMDMGGLSRKSSQVLTLRQKLLALPEVEFSAAIKTLEKLVENVAPSSSKSPESRQRQLGSKALYDDAKNSSKQVKTTT